VTLLYPRLLPDETERRFKQLHELPRRALDRLASTSSERAVFAATGGQRVDKKDLNRLREAVLQHAEDCGMPTSRSPEDLARFDRAVARLLHSETYMSPGEAAQPQVWAFLALALVPDVCAWRFPPRADGTFVGDRFKGTDLTRHTLARLWTRAHVLHEGHTDGNPYGLLDVLGEADLDQVMARRDAVAASPALVRAVVRCHRDDVETGGLPARTVLRESLKRLLRMTAFMDFDGLDDGQLDVIVKETRTQVRLSSAGSGEWH
jgi:hypothetical protein